MKTTLKVVKPSQQEEQTQERIVPSYHKSDDGVKIKAFTPDDHSELDHMTREELIAELGKTGVESEEVTAKVVEDVMTGETMSNRASELDLQQIDSLQDLNPAEIRKRFESITAQAIQMYLPDTLSDDELRDYLHGIEERLKDVTAAQVRRMMEPDLRKIAGDTLYDAVAKLNPEGSPVKTIRQFLIQMIGSLADVNTLIDTMRETEKALEFFKNNKYDELVSEINEELDKESDLYPTDLHRYAEYLVRHQKKLNEYPESERSTFIQDELELSANRHRAVTDALNFETVLTRASSLKTKLQKDFRERGYVDKVISDFVGRLQNDPTIAVTFPVPKSTDGKQIHTTKALASVWVLYLQVLDMQRKFPILNTLTHVEYADLWDLVRGVKTPHTRDRHNEIVSTDERLLELSKLADEHGIRAKHFSSAQTSALVYAFIIARAFKPSKLQSANDDNLTKYILSFTMNILAQAFSHVGYRELTYTFFNKITRLMNDKS